MEESLVSILSPKRRIDLLHDAMQAKQEGKPYVVTFCGVNGVGKSTNLAKVSHLIGCGHLMGVWSWLEHVKCICT